MKRALFLVLAFSAALAARAQPVTLYGRITDARSGNPLPRANVILGAERGAATDAEGYYRLEDIAPGVYTLIVSYVGYATYRRQLTLVPGEVRRLDVALEPQELKAGEVTVTAQRGGTSTQALSVARLDTEELQDLPAVLEPDIFRALQLLPGIQAASDFSSGLYIRGGSPDQTLILLDGAPVYNPTHVFGFFSAFNPAAIGEVVVYKGGYPAEYGGRLGSVVKLESKSTRPTEVTGILSAGLLASRAVLRGPYPKGTWMIAARRSTIEPLLYSLRRAGVEDLPERFSFYDLNGRFSFNASPADHFALSAYVGHDRLEIRLLDDARFDIAYGNRLLAVQWKHRFSEQAFSTLHLTASHYASDPLAEIAGAIFKQENNVRSYAADGSFVWAPGPRHTLEIGFRSGQFTTHLRTTFEEEVRFSPERRTTFVTGYVQDTFEPTPSWKLTGGLRTSYHAQGRYLRVAPRLSTTYRLGGEVRLQAGYGRYVQYLSLASNGLTSAFDIWLPAAEGVSPAYGDQFVAGLQAEPFDALHLEVEAYYRTMRDLFVIDPRLPDQAGVDYPDLFLTGDGYAYGLEVLLERKAGPVSGFLGYTLSWTRRRFPDIKVAPATGLPQYYPPKYDRRHNLTLVMNYDFAPGWRATSVFTYGTGQAYTQPNAQFKLVDASFADAPVPVLVSDFQAARLPAYHRLDLGVRKKGRFFGFADYELRFQIINVYGRRNIWFYFFETEDDGTIKHTDVPQIPVPLPNVSLTLKF